MVELTIYCVCIMKVCPLLCAVKRGCGFRCVGGVQIFCAIAQPEHPPTGIPRKTPLGRVRYGRFHGIYSLLKRGKG